MRVVGFTCVFFHPLKENLFKFRAASFSFILLRRPSEVVVRWHERALKHMDSWSETKVEVQALGSGRGDAERVVEGSGLSPEQHAERVATMEAHFVLAAKPAGGVAWRKEADAWLAPAIQRKRAQRILNVENRWRAG